MLPMINAPLSDLPGDESFQRPFFMGDPEQLEISLSINFDDLTSLRSYTFRVAARDAAGSYR